jgi:bifunctional non-homologous end joining protein LigD
LATLVNEVPVGSNWLFEMKYDGYRCLAAIAGPEVRLYTRTGKDWSQQFGNLSEPLSRLTKGTALIDGEICAFDAKGRTDFSTLKDALSDGGPLVYFAFDLLELDGEDLTGLPLIERKEKLQKLLGKVAKNSPIQYSDHVTGNGQKVFDAMCRGGFEGIIAKEANACYRNERTKSWLKVKCILRQEFVIAGWSPPIARRPLPPCCSAPGRATSSSIAAGSAPAFPSTTPGRCRKRSMPALVRRRPSPTRPAIFRAGPIGSNLSSSVK